MPAQADPTKDYVSMKELLDRVGQTEFLKMHGSLDDIYQIQLNFIYATCKYYDSKYLNRDKTNKIKKE